MKRLLASTSVVLLFACSDGTDPVGPDGSTDTTPPQLLGEVQGPPYSTCLPSLDIYWHTDEPADTRIEHGLTEPLEGVYVVDSLATFHWGRFEGYQDNDTVLVVVSSRDAAGNEWRSDLLRFPVMSFPDQTPPSCSIRKPLGSVTRVTDFVVTASDNICVERVVFFVGHRAGLDTLGVDYTPEDYGTYRGAYSVPLDPWALPPGTVELSTRVYDRNGNECVYGEWFVTICPDTLAPVMVGDLSLEVFQCGSPRGYLPYAEIEFKTDESASSIQLWTKAQSAEEGRWGPWDACGSGSSGTRWFCEITGLQEGETYELRLIAMDQCGGNSGEIYRGSFTAVCSGQAPP